MSETVSNDAFEALIDLLASDGVDESPQHPAKHYANVSLRDASGKLDFNKIRLMFASQNVSRFHGEEAGWVQSLQTTSQPDDRADSDDEPQYEPRSTPSTISSPAEPSIGGHRRSSTFGNEPWTIMHGNCNKEDVPVPSTLLHPLSFDELNAALAGAHGEVRALRQQCEDLQALVFKHLGIDLDQHLPAGMNTDEVVPDNSNRPVETRDTSSQAQPRVPSLPIDPPIEIARLSGDEAKKALSVLVVSLNLSPISIGPRASPVSPQHPPISAQQHDVASITRALKFVSAVDELVWRRNSNPSGSRTLTPVYSDENVATLLARLKLWEQATRS